MNTKPSPLDERWKERFTTYTKALSALDRALVQAAARAEEFTDLERDGVIQRFEFTVELAWKTLQDLLAARGYADVKGPRTVIKQAFHDGYIQDGHRWMQILESRNESVHLYDEERSVAIFESIQTLYIQPLHDLQERLHQESLRRESL